MDGRDRSFGPRFAPVKVGDELDVKIEAVGEKGDGIAKKEGFVLFVPNTKEGDEVQIRVTRVLRKVGFAEVVGEGSPSEAGDEEQPQEEESEDEVSEESSSDESSEEAQDVEDTEDFGEDMEEDKQ